MASSGPSPRTGRPILSTASGCRTHALRCPDSGSPQSPQSLLLLVLKGSIDRRGRWEESVKFRCDRDAFSEALQTVQQDVSSRPGIPALTGVLLNASGDRLLLATTDLEVSARLEVQAP